MNADKTAQPAAWPKGVIARYITVVGALVDLTHGDRTYPTPDGIGENRSHTTVTCTGCPATKEFSHWRVVKRMTFDDKVRDPEAADRDAREWAQSHAEKCRSLASSDRIGVRLAREALARSRATSVADPMVMARTIGSLEASLADVLSILDPEGER